jgi:hypothetical protein
MARYSDAIMAHFAASPAQLVPFPLCARHGFSRLELPIHHYAVAERIDSDQVAIFDRHFATKLSLTEFRDRVSWFLVAYGRVPQYKFGLSDGFVRLPQEPVSDLYGASLAMYAKVGRAALATYALQAEALEDKGLLHLLPASQLYTIVLALKAEHRFLSRHNDQRWKRSLGPHVDALHSAWRALAMRTALNTRAAKARFRDIPHDLERLLELEDRYAEAAQKTL